jgi:hypothetical protein
MAQHDNNSKITLFCEAWNGSRTLEFLKFKRDFMAGMGAYFLHEDDYSLAKAILDVDQGGQGAGADALPAPGQNGYANAVRRRNKRQAKAYERVYAHIDCESLREMLASCNP